MARLRADRLLNTLSGSSAMRAGHSTSTKSSNYRNFIMEKSDCCLENGKTGGRQSSKASTHSKILLKNLIKHILLDYNYFEQSVSCLDCLQTNTYGIHLSKNLSFVKGKYSCFKL